ncbi:MAG TPA: VWA domain-containing protein [Planctomycetota bacterium]|nr:VWA domain-containing protein [Planctomycetota bacterium]
MEARAKRSGRRRHEGRHKIEGGLRVGRFAAAAALGLALAVPGRLHAKVDAKEHSAALREMSRSESVLDIDAFLAALKTVLKGDDARSVRAAVASYSRIAAAARMKLEPRDLLSLHGKAAAAFAPVQSKAALDEFRKLLTAHREWEGRLLLLDASGVSKGVPRLESCLTALEDEHPIVIRRAVQYLARAKTVPAAEAVVKRYLDVVKKKGTASNASEWTRTQLAFQSALGSMFHVDLPAPEDYKNYFEARKDDPHLFNPEKRFSEDSRSSVTLFGAAVTGKYIIFVLDVSGSMLTTDPLPEGQKERERPRTVVVDPTRPPPKENPREDRQRMFRAKKELASVVRSLPDDVRFNIITYASEVHAWKKTMVPASGANKKSAAEHIAGFKADGITVTDMALEEAFSDLDVDTIYLVTDGAPTHIGTITGGRLPEDAHDLIRAIHERVEELNFLRGVRVFTLGFKDAEVNFLKKLAADNQGRHVEIR